MSHATDVALGFPDASDQREPRPPPPARPDASEQATEDHNAVVCDGKIERNTLVYDREPFAR